MATRPAIERMHFIATKIRAGEHWNEITVAAHFEVARKTIQRDVEFMRDRLGYDMEFNWKTKIWNCRPPPPIL